MATNDRIIDPNQEIWVAGHNDVGYSPDPDSVVAFATQEAARGHVADEIERLADGLDAVAWDTDEPDELADGAHADAENVRGNADQDYGDEFSVQVEDGRSLPTSFWVQRSTLGERYGDLAATELDQNEEFQSLLEELPEVGEVYVTASSVTPVLSQGEFLLHERHGWIDPQHSRVYLHGNMSDVRPLWTGTDPAEAAGAIRDYLGAVEPNDPNRPDTYYGADDEQDSDVTFSYAARVYGWDEDKLRQVEAAIAAPVERAIPDKVLLSPHEKALRAAHHAQSSALGLSR
jgi:hypothetical protein